MRPGKNGILVFVVILLITVGAFALFIRESILHSRTPAASRGLWLEVKPEKETYIVGEPVVLNLIIHNETDKDVDFDTPCPFYWTARLVHDHGDALEKRGDPTLPTGWRLSSVLWTREYRVPAGQKLTLQILLSECYDLDNSGEYDGELEFVVYFPTNTKEDTARPANPTNSLEYKGEHFTWKADFMIRVIQEGSLADIAKVLYDRWQAGDKSHSDDAEFALTELACVRSDVVIPYLREALHYSTDEQDSFAFEIICKGLARIESVASVTELVALCERVDLNENMLYECRYWALQLYQNTKNEDVRKIVKTVAEKHPNPEN